MSYRLEIGTALLLAVAIVIGIWAANQKPTTPDLDFRTSTYLSGPRGSQALYEVLSSLGRLSERRRTPLSTLATERAHRPAILVNHGPDGDGVGRPEVVVPSPELHVRRAVKHLDDAIRYHGRSSASTSVFCAYTVPRVKVFL